MQDSIGRALDAARTLPQGAQDAVVDLARDAFITSMRVVYLVAASVVVLAALVAWKFLPAHAPTEGVLFDEEVELAEALGVTDA